MIPRRVAVRTKIPIGVNGELLAEMRRRDDAAFGAHGQTPDGVLERLLVAGRVQRKIDAARHVLLNPGGDLAVFRIYGVGGSQFERELKPFIDDIDGNQWRGAGQSSRHHRTQSDRAGAEHRQHVLDANLHRIQDRPRPRLYTAGNGRHHLGCVVMRHRHHVSFERDRVGCKRGLLKKRAGDELTV